MINNFPTKLLLAPKPCPANVPVSCSDAFSSGAEC